MTGSTQQQPTTSRVFTFYVTLWLALGTLAVSYIVTATLAPGTLATMQARLLGMPEDNRSAVATGAPAAGSSERQVIDIAELRALADRIEAMEASQVAIAERLTLLEGTLADKRAASAAPTTTAAIDRATPATKSASEDRAAAGRRTAAISQPVATPQRPRVLNGEELAAPVEIDAIAAATAPQAAAPVSGKTRPPAPASPGFGQTEVRPADRPAGTVGLQLGAGTSLDQLRLNWTFLSAQNDALRNLDARFTRSDALGSQPYQLNVGPFDNREAAARACAQLRTKGVACRVGGFGGEAL